MAKDQRPKLSNDMLAEPVAALVEEQRASLSTLKLIQRRMEAIANDMRLGNTVMAYENLRQLIEFVDYESKK